MTREDILRMAREVSQNFANRNYEDDLVEFFNMAYAAGAAAEREECAKVCDFRARSYSMETDMWAHEHVSEAKICAAAIRARGEQEQPR